MRDPGAHLRHSPHLLRLMGALRRLRNLNGTGANQRPSAGAGT
jgi:hypothetical protein